MSIKGFFVKQLIMGHALPGSWTKSPHLEEYSFVCSLPSHHCRLSRLKSRGWGTGEGNQESCMWGIRSTFCGWVLSTLCPTHLTPTISVFLLWISDLKALYWKLEVYKVVKLIAWETGWNWRGNRNKSDRGFRKGKTADSKPHGG